MSAAFCFLNTFSAGGGKGENCGCRFGDVLRVAGVGRSVATKAAISGG